MDINITHLLDTDMYEFSHSAAEGGENAGRETWNAALNGPRPLLKTEEEFESFRDFARSTGEIASWDNNECQALFLQFVAGDVRQCPAILEGVEFEDRKECAQAATLEEIKSGCWYYSTEADRENEEETGPFESRSEAYRAASDELVGYNHTKRAESLEEIDWQEYEIQASEGRISGNLYRSDDGQLFYTLSN